MATSNNFTAWDWWDIWSGSRMEMRLRAPVTRGYFFLLGALRLVNAAKYRSEKNILWNPGYQWSYTVQQFPCILCITSAKSLVSCCDLYNVHEKSLHICTWKRMWTKLSEEQRAKKEKVPSFLPIQFNHFNSKKCIFCLSLWTFDNSTLINCICSAFYL